MEMGLYKAHSIRHTLQITILGIYIHTALRIERKEGVTWPKGLGSLSVEAEG